MEIGILASEGSWYYRDLERAAKQSGHACKLLDFTRLVAFVDSTNETIEHGVCISPSKQASDAAASVCVANEGSLKKRLGNAIPNHDWIIVRTMPPGSLEQVVYRMDILARMELSGTRVINSPKSLECAVDKFLTTARLKSAGLPVPETVTCEHEDDAQEAFHRLGGDVVVKPLFGSEGRGIVRVSDPDLAHRTFRTLMRLNCILYLQRFIDHGGFDVRILVLDGQVIGGIRRHSPNDFRTNVARNAVADRHDPTPKEIDLALRATAATGAFIAGVDLLYDRDSNCYVIEVNAVPGWQAFGRVTGIDVASCLIDRLNSISRQK